MTYVVIWIECVDEDDAERIEGRAVDAIEALARGRQVQNRIQDEQP